MNISQAFPSKYLKAADLQGRSFTLTISHVSLENVGNEQKQEIKPILYLRGAQKGIVLNKTNADALSIVLGDETDMWPNHAIEIFSMRVMGPNGMTDGIRMRCIVAGVPQPVAPAPGAAFNAPLGSLPGQTMPPAFGHAPGTPERSPVMGGGDLDDAIPF